MRGELVDTLNLLINKHRWRICAVDRRVTRGRRERERMRTIAAALCHASGAEIGKLTHCASMRKGASSLAR